MRIDYDHVGRALSIVLEYHKYPVSGSYFIIIVLLVFEYLNVFATYKLLFLNFVYLFEIEKERENMG